MKPGLTLPVVLLALAMTSALAVGGAYVTRQLVSVASTAERGLLAEPMSERALVDAVVSWDSLARFQQPLGSVAALPAPVATSIRTSAWVTRISSSTFWLVAESVDDRRPPLRRRIGLLVRVIGGVPALVPERAWSELP